MKKKTKHYKVKQCSILISDTMLSKCYTLHETSKATKDRRMGIQWTLMKQLEDLHFADDISLLAHRHERRTNQNRTRCR